MTAIALLATTAAAAELGPWQKLTASTGSNTQEVALARTPDGNLHVAWLQPTGSTTSLWHMSIPPAGGLQPALRIQQGWGSMSNPALAVGSDGSLDAFFGGIRSPGEPSDPFIDMNLATSTDGGINWSLQNNGDVVAAPSEAYGSPTAAAMEPGNTPLETWFSGGDVWVHAGTTGATPNSNFQTFGCCGSDPNIAVDPAGGATVAWFSVAPGHEGVYAQSVAADGSPVGKPTRMPGTRDILNDEQRTPLATRPQGGTYVASPTGSPLYNAVKLWKVGSRTPITVAHISGAGVRHAGLATDQAGRVWVFWTSSKDDQPRLLARRSNPAVTRFGPVVSVGAPRGANSVFSIDGNAGAGALDLFAVMDVGHNTSTWYRHVYPGLTIRVKPALVSVSRHHRATVRAVVTDAGVPVKGARVRIGGHTARTNRSGTATLHLRAKGFLTAHASRAGYVGASTRLEVTVTR